MRRILDLRAGRALAAAALLLTACEDDSPVPEEDGALGIVLLATGALELAVRVDGEPAPLFETVSFAGSTPYVPFAAGTYEVALVPAGVESPSALLEADEVSIADGLLYTLVAYGTVAPLDAFPLDSLVVVDESTPLVDVTRVRAVHVAPGVGDIEVLAVPVAGVATPIATGLAYGEVAEPVELGSATTYVFSVEIGGAPVPQARLSLAVTSSASVVHVFVTLGADGEPLLVGQVDDGLMVSSRPVTSDR